MELEYHIISYLLLLCVLIISHISFSFCLNLSHHNNNNNNNYHNHNNNNKKHTLLSISPLFIFGDSILDVGNNNYINTTTLDQANFWPYGLHFFHFPTGRFSDGRLVSDFIAEYANLPLIPPYLRPGKRRYSHGVNFASAGGGALVQTFQGLVINLQMQLKNYKEVEKWYKHKYGNVKARNKLSKGVYMFSVGINDYMSLFLTNSTMSTSYINKSHYVSMVLSNITFVINEIYKTGGRKFVFLNVPPIGCIPSLRLIANSNGDCLKEIDTFVKLHNEGLFESLKHLSNNLRGFKFSLYDFYTSTLQRIKHPSKHGFKEVETACCGTGEFRGVFSCGGKRLVKEYTLCRNINDHLFWDSIHFTEKTYMQIANEMWNNINYIHDSHGSYDIKELFYLR